MACLHKVKETFKEDILFPFHISTLLRDCVKIDFSRKSIPHVSSGIRLKNFEAENLGKFVLL
jgi:hypothetical protein